MRRHWFSIPILCLALIITAAASPDGQRSNLTTEAFLARHWQRPLPPQGEAPADFSPLERSLDPGACGICHTDQLRDWQGSLHAHAMGPGLLGQLLEMDPADRESHQACLRCHAPLAEQADQAAAWIAGNQDSIKHAKEGEIPNGPIYDKGLICAACHLRSWEIQGPPRRDGSGGTDDGAHGGFEAHDAFEDSRFCAACHQFESDGYALNGKLLENTYEEWLTSPQAEAGRSCQSCHMPDRRHLWRGIHDKTMVLSGITIQIEEIETSGVLLAARLVLANTDTGHRFPTYVTPRVVIEAVQLDSDGRLIPNTRQEQIIAREVSLDLSEERFDTRLAPGEKAVLNYRMAPHPGARMLRLRVEVEPDRFYRDFYQASIDYGWAGKGAETLRLALKAAEASVYTLFERKISLP